MVALDAEVHTINVILYVAPVPINLVAQVAAHSHPTRGITPFAVHFLHLCEIGRHSAHHGHADSRAVAWPMPFLKQTQQRTSHWYEHAVGALLPDEDIGG